MDNLMALNVLRQRLSDLMWSAIGADRPKRYRALRDALDLVDDMIDTQLGIPPFQRPKPDATAPP